MTYDLNPHNPNKKGLLPSLIMSLSILLSPLASEAQTRLVGGSSANPTDVTQYMVADHDILFDGGHFVVTLPESGASIVPAVSVDPYLNRMNNNGFSTENNPTIKYSGIISGDGVLHVRSGFKPQRVADGALFDGGALVFTNVNGQSWGLEGVPSGGQNAPALTIGNNVTVEFYDQKETAKTYVWPADPARSRNILNDGYLYVSAQNNWGSILGTGYNVFQFAGGKGRLAAIYSGRLFDFNSGTQIHPTAVFQNQPNGAPTNLESSDITVHVTKNNQSLALPQTFKPGDSLLKIDQDIHFGALNIQIWNTGIAQYNGVLLPLSMSKNHLELTSFSDAVQAKYFYTGAGQYDTINLTSRSTMLMGDGREIVTNPDGATNNVFLQGNPFNTLLSTNNFLNEYQGYKSQGLAFNYSGAYKVNFNLNAQTDLYGTRTNTNVIQGMRNKAWVNFFILNPRDWNPLATRPNHLILTAPAFLAGLTRIDKNAILQIGDGTLGNDVVNKQLIGRYKSVSGRYNDSMGNGMLITKGNQPLLLGDQDFNKDVVFEIVNEGRLIVNNTPGAMSSTLQKPGQLIGDRPAAAAAVVDWVGSNQLDGIKGTGSVEQIGMLPLTLGAPNGNPNSYSGGTLIAPGSTLAVASPTALGSAVSGLKDSGKVVNRGVLQATGSVRKISVPGNYVQR